MKFSAIPALVLIVILAGCSTNGDELSLPTTNPTTSSPVSTAALPATDSTEVPVTSSTETSEPVQETTTIEPQTPDPEVAIEEILAERIRGYFDARQIANAAPAPNPEDPGLAEFAVSQELAAVVANTQARLDAGEAIRPGDQALAETRIGFVEAGASSASAAACAVDDGVIFDVETDTVLNDDVITHNYQVELELHDGLWKVSRIVRVQQWEGVAGCALSPADYPF